MRLTITLCFLLVALWGIAQEDLSKLSGANELKAGIKCKVGDKSEPDSPAAGIRLRCGTLRARPALFIIDGQPVDTSDVRKLDPSNIASVEVLKNAGDVLVCGKNIGGVVLITTKKKQQVQFTIKEETGKEVITGATIQFKSVKDKRVQSFTSDHAGKLNVTSLTNDEEYNVVITSVGYKLSSTRYKHQVNNAPQDILLQRDEIIGPEVVVVASKRRRRGCPAPWHVRMDNPATKTETLPENKFVVFPNPLARGNAITIDISTAEQQAVIIRIHGRDGKLVWERSVQTVKGPNRFTVNTDSRWAAGVYFLQMIDGKKQVMKTEQVFIR